VFCGSVAAAWEQTMSVAEGAAGAADERRPGYWLLLTAGGLLLAGAVVLDAWTNTWVGPVRGSTTGPRSGIWLGYGPPLAHATYFPPPTNWFVYRNEVFLPSFYYLGWYWEVALAAAALLAVLWFRRDGRSGRGRYGRAYLATAVVLLTLALTLPLLTQALPWLASLWLRGPWVKGLPALVIAGFGLGILAWVEHSRGLARLTVLYAVLALVIGGWLASVPDYVLMFWPALTPEPWHLTQLDVLLGPAAVLIAAGLAFRRGRRPGRGRLPA
jgi:hypothetical protein